MGAPDLEPWLVADRKPATCQAMGGATLAVALRTRPRESSDFFTVRTGRRQAGTVEGSPMR
jgi:hypothetical protein